MAICRLSATTRGKVLRFDLHPGQPLTLGRSDSCTVRVGDPKMSREHCRLEFVDGRLMVIDLDSSHGLTLRGVIRREFELEMGDGFHAGQTFIRFEALEPELAAGSASVPVPQQADVPVRVEPRPAPVSTGPTEPEEYPTVTAGGQESVAERPARRRRRVAQGSGFLARLLGQLVLYATILVTGLAVLLALKHRNPDWDIYRLLDWLRPRK